MAGEAVWQYEMCDSNSAMEGAHVISDFPPAPPVATGPPAGVLRSDFRPATTHAAAVAALRQCVRSEVRDVRTEEVGGWRR